MTAGKSISVAKPGSVAGLPTNPSPISAYFPAPSLLLAASLAIISILVYFQTTTYPFVVYDDDDYVYENDRIKGGLTAEGFWWSLTAAHSHNWHPITWLSHMLDWELFGANAGGHHLTSVLIHAATAVSLLFALWRLTGELWPSAFVAAMFALHPLRVESVAWVAERKDVLSGFFFVSALRAYAHYVEEPSPGRYGVLALLFVLGLMSKPIVITLPCVLFLLDYWPLRRLEASPARQRSVWQLCREKIPLFLIAASSAFITMNAQTKALDVGASITREQRISNAIVSYGNYIAQSVYPVDLAVFYPHPRDRLPMWKVVTSGLFLLTISFLAFRLCERAPYLLVGWLWYLGMLVPVIGLVQVGVQAHADRYTYLPQIGLLLAFVWGVWDGLRLPRPVFLVSGAVILLVLAIQSWKQAAHWRDSETLFTHALSCTGPNANAQGLLGISLLLEGRHTEAITHLRKTLELAPDSALSKFYLSRAYNELGQDAAKRGDFDEAILALRVALDYQPDDAIRKRNLAIAHINRGRARVAQKGVLDALPDFQQAVALDSELGLARASLGGAFFDLGRYHEAVSEFQRAVTLNPNDTLAQRFLRSAIEKSKGGK